MNFHKIYWKFTKDWELKINNLNPLNRRWGGSEPTALFSESRIGTIGKCPLECDDFYFFMGQKREPRPEIGEIWILRHPRFYSSDDLWAY